MNIVFFCRYFHPHIGGVEKHVFEISKLLIQKGHTVTVVTEQHMASLPLIEKYKKITIHRIPIKKSEKFKKYEIWRWLFSNRSIMRNADIIHCHDVFFWYAPFRFLYPHKPVFTTFHGYEGYPISKKAIVIRKLSEKLSFANICIGKFITKWYKTNADVISYGGVDQHAVKKGKKRPTNSALFIGRIDPQTSIETYLKAIPIIQESFPDFSLDIIGEGSQKKIIPKGISLKGFEKDSFGVIPQYRFAFVSRYLSMLEAMVARRLVFAIHDNPVKKDYILHSPFRPNVVSAGSPAELASQVVFYLKHPRKEQEKIEKAYNWAITQSWEKVAASYLRLWRRKGLTE